MKDTAWQVPLAPLPQLQGRINADVCVIGLGGTGLAALRRLQKNKVRRIVGLDAVGVASGAAGRNGGFLLAGPAHFHHRAVQAWGPSIAQDLYRLTLDAIDGMEKAAPEWVDRIGSVRLAVDEAEQQDLAAHHQALRDGGFASELAAPDRLLIPSDAVFHPVERCAQLADEAWNAGAWLYGDSPVQRIEDGVVHTPTGQVHAAKIMVCTDGGLGTLLPELAPRLTPTRLQMLSTQPLPLGVAQHAMYQRNGLDYWQQRPDGRLLMGGCRDAGGAAEQGTVMPQCTAPVQDALDDLLRRVAGPGAIVEHRWAGVVTYTQDSLPIVEEVRDGLWGIGGFCGTGNVMGTLAAEAVADRIGGRMNESGFLQVLREAYGRG
ncbi:MAG: NAD(P)/FAD-dependent oxidoreductase [Myxococcota bacterium]